MCEEKLVDSAWRANLDHLQTECEGTQTEQHTEGSYTLKIVLTSTFGLLPPISVRLPSKNRTHHWAVLLYICLRSLEGRNSPWCSWDSQTSCTCPTIFRPQRPLPAPPAALLMKKKSTKNFLAEKHQKPPNVFQPWMCNMAVCIKCVYISFPPVLSDIKSSYLRLD